jgi:DNA replication protein DnaC
MDAAKALSARAEPPEWVSAFVLILRSLREHVGPIIVLYGPRGTGKTQMAVCALSCATRTMHGLYRRFSDLLDQQRAWFDAARRPLDSPLGIAANIGILVLDEIQEALTTAWAQGALANLLDSRYMAKLPTIMVANCDVAGLTELLHPSSVSRLEEIGVVIDCSWRSFR